MIETLVIQFVIGWLMFGSMVGGAGMMVLYQDKHQYKKFSRSRWVLAMLSMYLMGLFFWPLFFLVKTK